MSGTLFSVLHFITTYEYTNYCCLLFGEGRMRRHTTPGPPTIYLNDCRSFGCPWTPYEPLSERALIPQLSCLLMVFTNVGVCCLFLRYDVQLIDYCFFFFFFVIIYYNVLKQTIWLQLSSPSERKKKNFLPPPRFEPGSPTTNLENWRSRPLGYGPALVAHKSLYLT